jgi:CubicO group peptidase (beta-lactamase class C family)
MRAELATPSAVARALIEVGVAPSAAAGFARRGADMAGAAPSAQVGWELSVGASTEGPSRFFDLASLTKPMTALALARSGLDPATPLGDVLVEARGTPSERTSIELLLAHRSGLEANLPLFEPLLSGGSIDRAASLRAAASARRADASGSQAPYGSDGWPPIYSDLGYILVGEALARHVGARDAGEAIGGLVVGPLGLSRSLGTARALEGDEFSALVVPTEVVPWRGGEVRGRVHDENAWALTGEGGSGHAGMFGTIDAVLAFGAAAHDAIVLGQGPLAVAPATRAPDLDWLVRARPGGDLRAGFDGKSASGTSSAGERAGSRTFGHLGFTGTSLWIDPDARALVALLTNRVHPTRENAAIRVARPRAHDALFAMAAEASGR